MTSKQEAMRSFEELRKYFSDGFSEECQNINRLARKKDRAVELDNQDLIISICNQIRLAKLSREYYRGGLVALGDAFGIVFAQDEEDD